MNKLMLVLMCLFCVSCASDLKKYGKVHTIKMKSFETKESLSFNDREYTIGYIISKDNHCFNDTDDREIVTVLSDNLEPVVKHFYYRKISYDVKRVNKNGVDSLEFKPLDNTNVDLEVAYCVENYKHLLGSNVSLYASFRQRR